MSGFLHMPQGGAQVSMISQIPEVIMSGDPTVQQIYDTLGTYTYVIKSDNSYDLVDNIYDEYEVWEKASGNGDMCIINADKHAGLNFQPQSTNHPVEVKAMFIHRTIDLSSNRVLGFGKMSEGSWGATTLYVHLIPFDASKTVAQYIDMLVQHIGGTNNGIQTMSFVHNGTPGQNDLEGIMLKEIPTAGKYLVGLHVDSNQTNVCPSIYNLQFRTY